MPNVNIHRQAYFDTIIKIPEIKDCISGKNESKVLNLLYYLGYILNKDFVRQHPIGQKFVLDIAFVLEQVAIEVDGEPHKLPKNRKKDKLRDKFLYDNNWVVIRVDDDKFFKNPLFFKYLIQEVVDARRAQKDGGLLFPLDIPDFNEQNYD